MFLLYLVFRDEIENLLYNISDFEKGARNKTINSRGRARILDANSRETFRDREFSPMSVVKHLYAHAIPGFTFIYVVLYSTALYCVVLQIQKYNCCLWFKSE